MKPFYEVLGLAETIYKEWCCGAPRLKEWIDRETGDPYTPNQGRCRELAAQLKAGQYQKDARVVQKEEANLKPTKDRFSKEVSALHALLRDVKKLADAWDEKNLCGEDRILEGEKVWRQIRQILLRENKFERDRILRQLLGLKPRKKKIHTFTGDRVDFQVDSSDVEGGSKPSDSSIVYAQKSDFNLQLSKWRSLGEISETLPRPIIWHNKDYDEDMTAIGIFDDPGPDGGLYVRTLEGAGGLPFDEVEFLPVIVATVPDSRVDAMLEDEMEGYYS